MEKSNSRSVKLLLAFLMMGLRVFIFSEDLSPLETVKISNQEILDFYSTHKHIDKEAEQEIIKIMQNVTEFDIISKRTIERFCRKLSEEDCQTFDQVFKNLLQISSIKKLGRYRADRFDYLEEEINGAKATVKSIAYYKNEEVHLDDYLERLDDSWKIVNYVADDVDTIRNYRKQFTRIMRKGTFSQLIERLENKIRELQQEKQQIY